MKKDNKELKLNCRIQDGKIEYYDFDFRKKIDDFKAGKDGKNINIIFQPADSVEYYQMKFYRGYLLPDVAHFMGEKDSNYVHNFVLKKDFLLVKIDLNDVKSIPARYRARCILLCEQRDIGDGELKDVIWAYIPSTADLTYDEMKVFIEKVEHRLFADLNGRLGEVDENGNVLYNEAAKQRQDEAGELRDKIATEKVKQEFNGTEVKDG